MPKGFWIGACLAAGLLAGCSRGPAEENGPPPTPTPKTEVVTNPDGTTTTTTTLPIDGRK